MLQLLDPFPHYGGHGTTFFSTNRSYLSVCSSSSQVLTGILRHYATVLLATTPKALEQKALREQRSLLHGINVRQNFHVLSKRAFDTRRDALTAAYESGAFLKAPENRGQAPPNPMTDPNAMEGMMGAMKGQMAMIIPNTMIMSWINAFFSGYVISTSCRAWCNTSCRKVCGCANRDDLRSETAVPADCQIQEYAPGRRGYEGYGSEVDV